MLEVIYELKLVKTSVYLLLSKSSVGSLPNLFRIYGYKIFLLPIFEFSARNEEGELTLT